MEQLAIEFLMKSQPFFLICAVSGYEILTLKRLGTYSTKTITVLNVALFCL